MSEYDELLEDGLEEMAEMAKMDALEEAEERIRSRRFSAASHHWTSASST
ncbi:hypothetical protein OG292_16200 [Streptomyces sp. NBC_01511]